MLKLSLVKCWMERMPDGKNVNAGKNVSGKHVGADTELVLDCLL